MKFDEEILPPNRDCLLLHLKRCNYESVRKNCTCTPSLADDNGWELCDGNLTIKWMEIPPAPKSVLEYVKLIVRVKKVAPVDALV